MICYYMRISRLVKTNCLRYKLDEGKQGFDMTLLEQIRYAQEMAAWELRTSAAMEGRVPSALEIHQAKVNAGEQVVMTDLALRGLGAATGAGPARQER